MADETITDTATVEVEPTDIEADAPIEGEDALGDPGKRALDTMKQQLREAQKANKETKAELDRIRREAEMRDRPAEEQALEAARAEARAEAMVAANARILRSELRAAATGKLADPSDAALFIDVSAFDVSDDGSVDSDALTDAVDALIVSKPHLAVVKPTRFEGAADQGAKRAAGKPRQVTEEEVKTAYAAKNYEQIADWRKTGQLDEYLKSS